MISFQYKLFASLTSSQPIEFSKYTSCLDTKKKRLLQHNIHKYTMIWGPNLRTNPNLNKITNASSKSGTPLCVGSVTICSQPDEDAKSPADLPCSLCRKQTTHAEHLHHKQVISVNRLYLGHSR